MSLSRDQLAELIRSLSLTRSDEATCEDCLQRLAEFAEHTLAGKSVPVGLQAIEHHLILCGECREEYQALLSALEDQL